MAKNVGKPPVKNKAGSNAQQAPMPPAAKRMLGMMTNPAMPPAKAPTITKAKAVKKGR